MVFGSFGSGRPSTGPAQLAAYVSDPLPLVGPPGPDYDELIDSPDRAPLTVVNGAPNFETLDLTDKTVFGGVVPSSPSGRALGQPTPAAARTKVQLAVVRTDRGAHAARAAQCQWLASARARFMAQRATNGVCGTPVWLNARIGRPPKARAAKAASRWYYQLTRRLPRGCYTAYVRTVDAFGMSQTQFSAKRGNKRSFCVRG